MTSDSAPTPSSYSLEEAKNQLRWMARDSLVALRDHQARLEDSITDWYKWQANNQRPELARVVTPALIMNEFIRATVLMSEQIRGGVDFDGRPVMPPAYDCERVLLIARSFSAHLPANQAWTEFRIAVQFGLDASLGPEKQAANANALKALVGCPAVLLVIFSSSVASLLVLPFILVTIIAGGKILIDGLLYEGISGVLGPFLCLVAGSGLRGSLLVGTREQKLGGLAAAFVCAGVGVALVRHSGYYLHIAYVGINGLLWCAIGFGLGWMTTTRQHTVS